MERPDTYTPEMGARICAEIIGGKSVRSLCEQDWAPHRHTVLNWLTSHPDFVVMYNVAVVERAEGYAEEIVEIADNATNDWMAANDPENPGWKLNGEHVQRSKLRLDARKWICAKMKPKKYGEKVDLTHAGPEGGAIPLSLSVEYVVANQPAGET